MKMVTKQNLLNNPSRESWLKRILTYARKTSRSLRWDRHRICLPMMCNCNLLAWHYNLILFHDNCKVLVVITKIRELCDKILEPIGYIFGNTEMLESFIDPFRHSGLVIFLSICLTSSVVIVSTEIVSRVSPWKPQEIPNWNKVTVQLKRNINTNQQVRTIEIRRLVQYLPEFQQNLTCDFSPARDAN